MSQADIYAAGFLAQKHGETEQDNPYPLQKQPDHATWWCGWSLGKMAWAVGPEHAAKARADYVRRHGDGIDHAAVAPTPKPPNPAA